MKTDQNLGVIDIPAFLPPRVPYVLPLSVAASGPNPEIKALARGTALAPSRLPINGAPVKPQACRECGQPVRSKRGQAEFCSDKCRRNFGNRRMLRGSAFFDLVMAIRFQRSEAEAQGAWALLCRLAARCKADDERDRAGRQSWDDIEKVRARNSSLAATTIGLNVAGTHAGKRNRRGT